MGKHHNFWSKNHHYLFLLSFDRYSFQNPSKYVDTKKLVNLYVLPYLWLGDSIKKKKNSSPFPPPLCLAAQGAGKFHIQEVNKVLRRSIKCRHTSIGIQSYGLVGLEVLALVFFSCLRLRPSLPSMPCQCSFSH